MLSKKHLTENYGDEIVWYDKKRRFGLRLSFTHYILTKTKLYVRTGFFNIQEEQLELYKVVDNTLVLKLRQRLFGCGTISIKSNDKTNPVQELISIKRPRTALNLLEEYVDAERKKYKVYGRDMIASSGVLHDCDDI